MATLVRCVHCGAPHRAVSVRERFVCAYCRGSNRLESVTRHEELVCPGRRSSKDVREAVLRELQLRGLRELRVRTRESRFLPIWQLISAEGEEFLLPADMAGDSLAAGVRPPAAPLISRSDPSARDLGDLPRAPAVPREEAESAALAAFEHAEAPIESTRLLWYAVTPVELGTRVGTLRGLFLEGADKLILEAVPPAARDEPLRPELLFSLLAFLSCCLLWGSWADSVPALVLGLALCCGGAWLWFRRLLPSRQKDRA